MVVREQSYSIRPPNNLSNKNERRISVVTEAARSKLQKILFVVSSVYKHLSTWTEEKIMRISFTLDDRTAQTLRRRAEARNQSIPRYLTEIARAEAMHEDDALAEEGYRLLANDTKTSQRTRF